MTRTLTILICVLVFLSHPVTAQPGFRVMSYNVENLFDTEDTPD